MDMAAGIEARHHAKSRVVTVAIDGLTFIKPVYVGDTVSCYVEMLKIGKTSLQLKIEVWTFSLQDERQKKVAEGLFTFVALNSEGKAHPVLR
jgi:acyl-CoA thioesterase YciA